MESRDASHTSEKPHPKAIVCLYAQHDEPWYRELQKYFVVWQKQGRIYWADLTSIHQADLVLLLLSPDFFAARGCQMGMARAFEVRTERGIPIVPVLARVSNWKESACGALKALPDNERPVVEWRQKERAYENICIGLARLLPDLPASLGNAPPEGLRLFQARNLPGGYVARSNELAAAKQLLLHQQGTQTTAITTALRGAGGFGKTTLALALCHDLEIQAAFPDGILWVELGEHPPRPLDVLNGILASLEPSRTEAVTLEEAKKRWQAALHDRMCLLVIDDVWQVETLLPLLDGGPHCQRLLTTRNDLLLPRDAARVLVDAMGPHEAVAVLCQGLPATLSQATHQSNLEALAARLGYWPLLLTLANGLLTELVDAQMSIAEALAVVAEAYQTRGVTAFRLDNVEERQRTVDACLNVSMHHLETFPPAHYDAAERYQELAVFPEDTDIPLATLQVYWKRNAGLEPWETKDLCIRLHRLSLLLTCDLGKGTIRLHDVVRSYLIQRSGSDLPILHALLLDACQQEYGVTRWADLPSSEVYLWQHLILHLCQAGRQDVLQTTLTDLWYLIRKALFAGVSALEADLLLASIWQQTDPVASVPSPFVSLHRSIVRVSHLLLQVKTEAETGGLLLSHLGSHPSFAAQQHAWKRELPRPFLTTWHPLPDGASSALLRTLRGHTSVVWGCAVSADGRTIVSASEDGTLKVWDGATGVERLTLRGHSERVYGCAVSADGRTIVSVSSDKMLKVWDGATGVERLTLGGHFEPLHSCAVSADGRTIVSASFDDTLKVWDGATGVERLTLRGHSDSLHGCAVSADGRTIVSSSKNGTLKVWDSATGKQRLTLEGHICFTTDCAISGDGRTIVSASEDGTLKVWDGATGVERLTLGGPWGVFGYAVSADGRTIVAVSFDDTLKVWDGATGVERLTLRGYSVQAYGCAVSADGRTIVSSSKNGTLKVWDGAREEERLTLRGHSLEVCGCAVSADGRTIVSASSDHTLKVWDGAKGEERLTLRGHSDGVQDCAVSADGRTIVSASWDNTLKVWDGARGKERLTLRGHTSTVWGCAISANGRTIVSASSDHTLKVWDGARGKERLTLRGHTAAVHGCAISGDGRTIISASEDGTLKVWDGATGVERLTLRGHSERVWGCAVSADGRTIVSASEDGTLKVWDGATGVERLTLRGHSERVWGCAISGDGRTIISASEDETLRVWETQAGRCLLTFPVDGRLVGCTFHPDGEYLVACGRQGMYFLRLVT